MARDNKNTERKQSSRGGKEKIFKAKACAFCKDGVKAIDYKDTNLLRKFISDRGKIRARRVTGVRASAGAARRCSLQRGVKGWGSPRPSPGARCPPARCSDRPIPPDARRAAWG